MTNTHNAQRNQLQNPSYSAHVPRMSTGFPPRVSFTINASAHSSTSDHCLSPPISADDTGTTPATRPATGEGSAAALSSDSAVVGSSTGAASVEAVVRMVKDVDGMISRLPAARGSKGPTDGDLSALEEEVGG